MPGLASRLLICVTQRHLDPIPVMPCAVIFKETAPGGGCRLGRFSQLSFSLLSAILPPGRIAHGGDFSMSNRQVSDLINEGARLLSLGKALEAIPFLKEAFEREPENIGAAINLGGAYVMAGKQRQAVPVLEKARDLDPQNPMVWINLGAAYLDRPPFMTSEGEEKAIQAFEHALELDPNAFSVSYNLGLIYKDRGELERALEHFEAALRCYSEDTHAAYWCKAIRAELQKDAGKAAES